MKVFRWFLIAGGWLLYLVPHSVLGADSKSLEDRMETLDQRQQVLEEHWKTEQEKALKKGASDLYVGENGLIGKSSNGDFSIRLGGVLQADERIFTGTNLAGVNGDTFVLRRVRPIFEGTLYRSFDFRIMPDFGSGTTTLQDGYVGINLLPELKLLAGKYKTPFGLERNQTDADTEFAERSLVDNLVPNRDVGIRLHGDIGNGVFDYAIGIFNGVMDSGSADVDNNNSKDFAGRIFAHPFKQSGIDWLKGLGLGVAGTIGDHSGTLATPNLPSYMTPGQRAFFSYSPSTGTTIANGEQRRISPQAYYYVGPFGMLSEYVSSTQGVVKSTSSATLENKAWQVAAYYVLTGEAASYHGIKPNHPFDPKTGQWGAFELTARYHQLAVDKNAFPIYADPTKAAQKAVAWGTGLNWYFNKNFKFVANYENTSFNGGAIGADRPTEKVFITRFQIAF